MGDTFGAMRQDSQRRRIKNLDSSTKLLIEKGIKFESKNNGIHLIVEDFDFYPSTGLFKNRKTGKKGRGVFSLIKQIQKCKSCNGRGYGYGYSEYGIATIRVACPQCDGEGITRTKK